MRPGSSGILAAAAGALAFTVITVMDRRPAPAWAPATPRLPGSGTPGGSDRGEDASTPSEIPPRGWWDILKRTAQQISDDRVMTEAAGITFFTLLALFPGIAALISIYGLFADPAAIGQHLSMLSTMVPSGGMEIINDQVGRITSKGSGSLGVGAIIGFVTSLWSARQAVTAMIDSLNIVYGEKETRGFFHRVMLTLVFTLGGILFLGLAMAAVVVVPVVLNFIGFGGIGPMLLDLARWPLLLVGIALLLAVLYRFGPDREKAQWRWISWGSGFASILWIGFSIAFSWYVAKFGSYNETYGSLGAAIGFMTWIWLSAAVVLMGAELDAEMEHQTARDTTTGPERPLGARGARMADSVAAR